MATGQTDRELLLALMRNPGVLPNVDPFTYPQNAPNVPKMAGQQLLDFAQALERDPNRRATGLEEVVELIGKMGVINPLKTAGSLMQLDKPTVKRMAQSGVDAAKRAYDDPSGTARRVAQGAKEALLDPVGTAGELSVSDVVGGSGLLSKLAGGASLTGPALMAAMVPGSDVPRPKTGRALRTKELMQEQLDRGETLGALERGRLEGQMTLGPDDARARQATLKQASDEIDEKVKVGILTKDEAKAKKAPLIKEFLELNKILHEGGPEYRLRMARLDVDDSRRQLSALDALDDVEKARLDRAVQQGFNLDAFHGTKGDITEFDPGLLGVTTGAESARKGFFFSADPETADDYTRMAFSSKVRKDQYNPNRLSELKYEQNEIAATLDRMEKNMAAKYPDANQQTIDEMLFQNDDYRKLEKRESEIEAWLDAGYSTREGENIMPVKLKLDNPLIHDFEGSKYREQSYDNLLEQAKENGHDGAIFKNTYDGGPLTDVYVVFEPEQIRSRFAMFDPKDAPNVTVNPNWKEELPELEKLEKRRAFSEKMMNQAYDKLRDRNITERKRNELRKQFDIHSDAEYKLSEQIKAMQPKKYAYTGAKNILASVPPVLFPLGVGAAAASYSANKEE